MKFEASRSCCYSKSIQVVPKRFYDDSKMLPKRFKKSYSIAIIRSVGEAGTQRTVCLPAADGHARPSIGQADRLASRKMLTFTSDQRKRTFEKFKVHFRQSDIKLPLLQVHSRLSEVNFPDVNFET